MIYKSLSHSKLISSFEILKIHNTRARPESLLIINPIKCDEDFNLMKFIQKFFCAVWELWLYNAFLHHRCLDWGGRGGLHSTFISVLEIFPWKFIEAVIFSRVFVSNSIIILIFFTSSSSPSSIQFTSSISTTASPFNLNLMVNEHQIMNDIAAITMYVSYPYVVTL